MSTDLKNKRVLVLGLGLLGGGVATTNWLLDNGARVTVSDLKDAHALATSVKNVEDHLKRSAPDGASYEKAHSRLSWTLGGHTDALVDAADLVVADPDVSVNDRFIRRAVKRGIPVANEATLFYERWKKPVIGVTGTRGKTTTATWTNHFIVTSVLTGNSTVRPFLAALNEPARRTAAVTELSSFILELFDQIPQAPRVAVITNIYRDHLNRHGTMENYAQSKANIFKHQTTSDTLILNADDEWTLWFVRQRPAARVLLTSLSGLPAGKEGIWYSDGALWERGAHDRPVVQLQDFPSKWGMHNVANLMQAALAARVAGVGWSRIQSRLASLPEIPFRQEVIYRDARLTVVNDTTATSPEAGIAALQRWGGPTCVLITGGTDAELDYHSWAKELPQFVRRTNTIFLTGSATRKMRTALRSHGRGIRAYSGLAAAWDAALKRARTYVSSVIVFSPSAKSFELFANEFDRGQRFNTIVKEKLP